MNTEAKNDDDDDDDANDDDRVFRWMDVSFLFTNSNIPTLLSSRRIGNIMTECALGFNTRTYVIDVYINGNEKIGVIYLVDRSRI